MEEADFKRLLDANAAETRAYFDVIAGQLKEIRQEIVASADGLRQELRQDIVASADGLRQELRQEMASSAAGLRQEMAQMRQELRDDFGALADHLGSKIELLAEGLGIVNERLDREAADIRAEMRQGFAETQDLVRFAYRDLDHRTR